MFIMVANCRRIVKNNKISEVKSYIKKFYLIFSTKIIYSWLFLLIVPSILCETDKHRNLTYEEIYKNTQYAQIHNYTLRPHNRVNKSQNVNVTKSEDFEGNEVEDEIDGLLSKSTLLVGFARDPYRYSIPEDDYMKGVRYMEPPVFPNKGDIRGKRGVVHLYNMLTCATGCDPLSYKGYGCYCGFLGAGRPTDGIDRCCKMHDQCYENIYCPFYTVYFQPYYWKCYHGEPLCALENWQTRHQFVNGCAGRLCECDRLFAMCVKRFSCPRGRALCRSSPIRLLQNVLMLR